MRNDEPVMDGELTGNTEGFGEFGAGDRKDDFRADFAGVLERNGTFPMIGA